MGPFQWDLLDSSVNVNKGMDGKPLKFFSRYYDQLQKLACVIAEPYDNKTFSISSSNGKRVAKVYNHAMIAVFVRFN